jgi:hypothetical protein
MLTFKELVSDLARKEVTLSSSDLKRMIARFGEKVLLMGHLESDGSMRIPVECIVEAASLMGSRGLTEAAESLVNEEIVSALQSGETLIERVVEARDRMLRNMIRDFQNEPDAAVANGQWKNIEKEVFGVEFRD